jgi:hypothetical protein
VRVDLRIALATLCTCWIVFVDSVVYVRPGSRHASLAACVGGTESLLRCFVIESCYTYDVSRTIRVRRHRSIVRCSRARTRRSPTKPLLPSIARRTQVGRRVSYAQQFRL